MILKIIGSGSSGNCYLLEAGAGTTLMIECGVAPRRVLEAVGHDIGPLQRGLCLVSHEHGDHSAHLADIMRMGVRAYALERVFLSRGIMPRGLLGGMARLASDKVGIRAGGFSVRPFRVSHDVPCLGFVIDHEEMGRTVFVTDTFMMEYRLPSDTRHVMVECNYADDILEGNIVQGLVPRAMRERLMRTHMELGTVRDMLLANDLRGVQDVVLLHLSDGNSDAERFRREIHAACGLPVYVAKSADTEGVQAMEFNDTPY